MELVASDASSGLAAVEYAVNSGSTLVVEPYVPVVGHPQLSVEGSYTFAVSVRDRAGHRSAVTSRDIQFDTLPPVPGVPALVLENGAAITHEPGLMRCSCPLTVALRVHRG